MWDVLNLIFFLLRIVVFIWMCWKKFGQTISKRVWKIRAIFLEKITFHSNNKKFVDILFQVDENSDNFKNHTQKSSANAFNTRLLNSIRSCVFFTQLSTTFAKNWIHKIIYSFKCSAQEHYKSVDLLCKLKSKNHYSQIPRICWRNQFCSTKLTCVAVS